MRIMNEERKKQEKKKKKSERENYNSKNECLCQIVINLLG